MWPGGGKSLRAAHTSYMTATKIRPSGEAPYRRQQATRENPDFGMKLVAC